MASKQGKKRQKDKWSHFLAATILGFPKAKQCWTYEVAEAHECWTFDVIEIHEAQGAGSLGRGRFSKHKNGNSEDLYLREVEKKLGSLGLLSSRGTKKAEFRFTFMKHKHAGN